MKNAKLITISLATATLVALATGPRVQGAEPQARDDSRARQYAGSTDAWQHGYEHAYRDGSDQGRQDRERRTSYNLRDSSYWGQRGYEKAFGDRNQYLDGYRQGYQAGYDEAFYGVSGQYGQLYARPQAGRLPAGNDPYAIASTVRRIMPDAGYANMLGQRIAAEHAIQLSEQRHLSQRRHGARSQRRPGLLLRAVPRRHPARL